MEDNSPPDFMVRYVNDANEKGAVYYMFDSGGEWARRAAYSHFRGMYQKIRTQPITEPVITIDMRKKK